MNKKIILSVVAILVCIVAFGGLNILKNKDIIEGKKTISIEVVSKPDKVDKTYEINTDKEFLGEVISTEDGYLVDSNMLIQVKGINLKDSKSDYWHVYINDKDAQVGVNELTIKNGDKIKFERKSFL